MRLTLVPSSIGTITLRLAIKATHRSGFFVPKFRQVFAGEISRPKINRQWFQL
ncbi:hypothetical protein L3V77_03485 [Vibrio sp. DW001]|uniref:hypothetical protein n=1 Tax=Vibrio sp. DW001 TaxID=2912315 RepID=UPI0023B1BECD|nr:hypothetical protein [Vibrio sp. DW001]WED27310.1 hypothetical protein L3V77_03485 [Vibrio sp. DW001]